MQPAGIEATLATDSQVALIKPPESAALTSLVAHIDQKLARTLPGLFVPDEFAHDPDLALRRKLRSALQPLSFPDEEGRCAYLWPSSHLTGQDMARLRIWGRLTGLPSNQLLHLSVTVMSEWLRLHLAQVLAHHEESGKHPARHFLVESAQGVGSRFRASVLPLWLIVGRKRLPTPLA